jgi:hypothetical protein
MDLSPVEQATMHSLQIGLARISAFDLEWLSGY